MNKQKLYAAKNDEGKYWDFRDRDGFWPLCAVFYPATSNNKLAEKAADENGGHVVTLIEEPKKVVLTKEQAEIVEDARDFDEDPAGYISDNTNLAASGEEELLMRAYVNGYTLAKEKKYNVKVPLVQSQGGLWFFINSDDKLDATYLQGLGKKFTMDEIEHYGLQDCEKVECDNDED